MTRATIYSFVVDEGSAFAHHGWLLAKSLCLECGANPADVHVQITEAVAPDVVGHFARCGYRIHALRRFGDGRWCNKLAQLPNLLAEPFDIAVLLDTDTLAVGDLRPFLRTEAVLGKVVDFPNPSLAVLLELRRLAGGKGRPRTFRSDALDELTLLGNCNGGFYAVPRPLAERFDAEWRRWALWLLEKGEPLRRAGRMKNVDQVSAALAFQCSDVPFLPAPSNVNYFLHTRAPHHWHDPSRPIALLHHHGMLDAQGHVKPPFPLTLSEAEAIGRANAWIGEERQPHLAPG